MFCVDRYRNRKRAECVGKFKTFHEACDFAKTLDFPTMLRWENPDK